MSNIEKIRQEIERRKKVYLTKNGFPKGTFGAIKIETYEGLLSFIDSLPEEKPSNDLEEAAARYERENRESILSSVDIVDAFIAGAEWQGGRLTVEDIKTILDISFWNDDPEKILQEYNRLKK